MIRITDKHNCCGCSACVQVCPKQCISFEEDEKGFRYPQVDEGKCVDCGLCEKVCPVLHAGEPRKPLKVYGAINPNEEIRMKSSSGGIFTMLAEAVIDEGGVVFGARFNDQWEVVHDYTETKEGLTPFRGSKYVQSIIGDSYKQAKQFLIEGRRVLFTGTSCQIAGLKNFLGKDYENLLAVDVVCHGVPSPLVWREYLKTIIPSQNGKAKITGVSFRDKSTGWEKFSLVVRGKFDTSVDQFSTLDGNEVILHETLYENLFMKFFLKNLCLRPSCFYCSAKAGKSGSDLSIADYWGGNYYPEWNDDKGISLILVNDKKGETFLAPLKLEKKNSLYEYAIQGNPSIEKSVKSIIYIDYFWKAFKKNGIEGSYSTLNVMRSPFFIRLFSRLKIRLSKFL